MSASPKKLLIMSDAECHSLEITVDETMILAHKQPFTTAFTINEHDFQLTFQHEQSKLTMQLKSMDVKNKPAVFYYKLSVLDTVGNGVILPEKAITYLNDTKVTLAAKQQQMVLRTIGVVRTRLFMEPMIRVHVTLSICRGMKTFADKTLIADQAEIEEQQLDNIKAESAAEGIKARQVAAFPASLVKHEEKMKKSVKSSEDAATAWFVVGNEAAVPSNSNT